MEGLCRFCAKSDCGIDVFGEAGQKKNLYNKIKLCLPINITLNDGITTHICFPCITKLNISYEFHTTCVSVQYQLRSIVEGREKNESALRKYSNPDIPLEKPSNRTSSTAINDSSEPAHSNETSLKTNNNSDIRIEAVQTISQNIFQNMTDPDEFRKNGKRLLVNSDKETAKKKERMTVCQYCRKWFPRSLIIHHEKLHVKGSITFNCTLCNKDFQEAEDFKNHECAGEGD